MKDLLAIVITITIYMQPTTAVAADYSDFDSHCNMLWQHELALIQKDVEEGELTEAEAKEEISYGSKSMVEQCVCYYQKVLDGGGSNFILYLQKIDIIQMDDDYSTEAIKKLVVPKIPEGLNLDALLTASATECGIDLD